MRIKDALLEYKQYLIVEKGRSKNTVNSYLSDLRLFQRFLKEQYNISNIDDVTTSQIEDYLKVIHQNTTNRTITRKIVS